jgi:leishmanolysin-like peptidase
VTKNPLRTLLDSGFRPDPTVTDDIAPTVSFYYSIFYFVVSQSIHIFTQKEIIRTPRNEMNSFRTNVELSLAVIMMVISVLAIILRYHHLLAADFQLHRFIHQVATVSPPPPHIIMIMVDDLGWNGFSLHGKNNEVKNPTMEKLAQQGILLENYYVYKYCSPSRASFLTGRVPGHGIWEMNPSDAAQVGVNLKATMLPALLKEKANYTTHQIGKWHQGFYAPAYTPMGRGFDTSFGYYMGQSDHFNSCHTCLNLPDYSNHSTSCLGQGGACNVTCGVDLYRNNRPAIGENGTYTAYLWANEAVRVIEETAARNHYADTDPRYAHSDASDTRKPMFLYLALHNVHLPLEVPPEFVNKYPESDYNSTTIPRRYYNAMAFSVDAVVENVTQALIRNGMYENSVIVISTDNGGTFEHRGSVHGSSNYPLRGYKYSYFEGGVRGFAMVVSPLLPQAKQGTSSRTLLAIYDWYPTFCRLAGITDEYCVSEHDQLAEVAPLDGVNAWELLIRGDGGDDDGGQERPPSCWANRGGPRANEVLLGVGLGKEGALRQGDMKIIVGKPGMDGWSAQYPGSTEARSPGENNDSLCTGEVPCLFNITNDPTEENNLAHAMPELTEALAQRYKELAAAMTVPNGYEDQLANLVWDGSYHVPRYENTEACDVVRKTGFWMPWKDSPSHPLSPEFPEDGPARSFSQAVVLI